MTIAFLLMLAILGFLMKAAVLLLPPSRKFPAWRLILSPVPSPRSLKPAAQEDRVSRLIPRTLLFLAAFGGWFFGSCWMIERFELHGPVLAYFGAPLLVLGGESLGRVVQVLWLPFGISLPLVHDAPLRTESVTIFWGRRWNVWFSDWFRYVIFDRMKKRPVAALLVSFTFSGLMHEWVINLPLWWITGRTLFGSQMLYFMLQAAGVLMERRWRPGNRWVRRGFAWLWVLGPLPLLFNEGLLRAFCLWPD